MDTDLPLNNTLPPSLAPSAPGSTIDNPASMPQTPDEFIDVAVVPKDEGEGEGEGIEVDSMEMDEAEKEEQEKMLQEEPDNSVAEMDAKARLGKITFLLEKSSVYARLIGERMERQRVEKIEQEKRATVRAENKAKAAAIAAETEAEGLVRRGSRRKNVKGEENSAMDVDTPTAPPQPTTTTTTTEPQPTNKRKRGPPVSVHPKPKHSTTALLPDDINPEDLLSSTTTTNPNSNSTPITPTSKDGRVYIGPEQPALIKGAKLRDYQLAGVQWMISLYENGLNGILADEMGLGKTLQTIAFLASLYQKGTGGPFLVVCPLSVLSNWITEFAKFAPDIPVVMYHGSKQHRDEIRRTQMTLKAADALPKTAQNLKKAGSDGLLPKETFPVIVTTYEMIIFDQKHLSKYQWKYIVVDEGHRLKNFNCKLVQMLKTFTSANRLILTGTPLHNNLAELWSLLNFILPDIFDDLSSFQSWFDFAELQEGQDGEAKVLDKSSIVTSLHAILKPFLLRRLKEEVEPDLPLKKEYLLYAPLTQQQKDIYQAVLNRDIRNYLIAKKAGLGNSSSDSIDIDALDDSAAPTEADTSAVTSRAATPNGSPAGRTSSRLNKKPRLNYKLDDNDARFIDQLEKGKITGNMVAEFTPERSAAEIGAEYAMKKALKQVANMKLQNIIMQLRKVSNHPFLFDWPFDPLTGLHAVNEDLINASGKMLLLQRLLDALFAKKHRVLLFSQFTSMLDVIQDWAEEYKGWKVNRIDGSTSQQLRMSQMNDFNNADLNSPDCPNLFLLSTRAGGLGINLVSADTVIFFDQDWNPQQDLQAAARAHRIGQTKPVLIFRLLSDHTVETKILQKASAKRKLEALVISQGKFGKIVSETGETTLGRAPKGEAALEMAKALLDLDSEAVRIVNKDDNIIADEDLEILLDRSEAAMARGAGWTAGLGDANAKRTAGGEHAAFEVFEPSKDEAGDALASNMFAEEK